MLKKTIPMTLEHAVNITNDMLDVLHAFFEVHPFFRLSQSVENGQTKYAYSPICKFTYQYLPD